MRQEQEDEYILIVLFLLRRFAVLFVCLGSGYSLSKLIILVATEMSYFKWALGATVYSCRAALCLLLEPCFSHLVRITLITNGDNAELTTPPNSERVALSTHTFCNELNCHRVNSSSLILVEECARGHTV